MFESYIDEDLSSEELCQFVYIINRKEDIPDLPCSDNNIQIYQEILMYNLSREGCVYLIPPTTTN